ncbi:MAG: hypothetical protein M3P33_01565 [bacterium]|nr:hypothetical protein [bacterium]
MPVLKQNLSIITKLKGLSIIMIVFYHYFLDLTRNDILPRQGNLYQNLRIFNIFQDDSVLSKLNTTLAILFASGWHFVGIFIFLSGFGLTISSLNKKMIILTFGEIA